jgi:uncharacterized delta-60 repeat protein
LIQTMKKRLVLVLALVACSFPAAAQAQGKLDPGFGEGGRAVRAVGVDGFFYSPLDRAAESPDGRVFVLANERTLLAFESNGSVATGFGAGGSVEVFRPGERVVPVGIAVDPQGRVLVAGTALPQEEPEQEPPTADPPIGETPQAIFVVRYTPAGQPDPSFGGDGRIVTNLGLAPAQVPADPRWGPGGAGPTRTRASGIAVDAAGRIVLSGAHLARYEVCKADGMPNSRWESFLARLRDDGRPDPSFGNAGVTVLGAGPVGVPVPDESGGAYASVGTPFPVCALSQREAVGYLFHLDAAGAPVASFGQSGWRNIPEDVNVKLLTDGRGGLILMPSNGSWRRKLILRRLNADGSWDRHFGGGSVAEPFEGPRGTLSFADAAIGRGGQIYVTGSWVRKARASAAKRRFLLFRLDRHGGLDRRYGVLRTGFGKGSAAFSRSLLIAPGGGPLLIGALQSSVLPGGQGVALARYLPSR